MTPDSSRRAQEELEDLGSPIGAFLRECCVVEPGRSVRCDDLYNLWKDWCQHQGRDHPGTVQTFGRDLGAAVPGLIAKQYRDGEVRLRRYEGVGLNPDRHLSRSVTRDGALHSNRSPYYADDPGYQGHA